MQIIRDNPYRIIGLLVGAKAKEQERQIRRLKQFIEADQIPQNDFSFPIFGKFCRTIENVSEASSKLNLDIDKMSSALFWFYQGYKITDEPAFDALKEGDISVAESIWLKLIAENRVTERNASAFFNLGTLYLTGKLPNINEKDALLEKGIMLKLKFIESEFIDNFKDLVTDLTYQTSKNELQLLFLRQIQSELEKKNSSVLNKLMFFLAKQEFSAKKEYLNSYVNIIVQKIERSIDEVRNKNKLNPENAGDLGLFLYKSNKILLKPILEILGNEDPLSISISDKLANEILQCSITLFNHFHDTETEVGEVALDLNKKANSLALGKIVKGRLQESTPIVENYIKHRPEREKTKLIKPEIDLIYQRIEHFELTHESIRNVRHLINECRPLILRIKSKLGIEDDVYLNISSLMVQSALNVLINIVNRQIGLTTFIYGSPELSNTVMDALDTTFKLGLLDMNKALNKHYKENLEGIKEIAKQLNISTLTPKELKKAELDEAEKILKIIQKSVFLKKEIDVAQKKLEEISDTQYFISEIKQQIGILDEIKRWKIFRTTSTRNEQIKKQEQIILDLKSKGDTERKINLNAQQLKIEKLRTKAHREQEQQIEIQLTKINKIKKELLKLEY